MLPKRDSRFVQNTQENLGADDGIVERTVMVCIGNVKVAGDCHEFVARKGWQKEFCHVVAVQPTGCETAAELKFETAFVERIIVGDEKFAFHLRQQFVLDFCPTGGIGDHVIADAGHDGDVSRDAFLWLDERLPRVRDDTVFNNGQADFDNFSVVLEAGGLYVDGDKISVFFHYNAQLFR